MSVKVLTSRFACLYQRGQPFEKMTVNHHQQRFQFGTVEGTAHHQRTSQGSWFLTILSDLPTPREWRFRRLMGMQGRVFHTLPQNMPFDV
ncbi:MAG TPA: hypothetical protein PKE62_07420 [Anaerolineales bacterium]|nr:hypothetical protein [Anaerolineales bacterium]